MSAARRATRNPAAGTHPDLFEGESRIYVPLEELTEGQIIALPRAAFSDDEWEDLDEGVQELIYESDPESEKIVRALRQTLEERLPEADEDYAFGLIEEVFESELAEAAGAGTLVDWFPADRDAILTALEGRYSEEDILQALNTALADSNVYEFSVEEGEVHHIPSLSVGEQVVDVGMSDDPLLELLAQEVKDRGGRLVVERRAPFDDEIARAIDQVDALRPEWEGVYAVDGIRRAVAAPYGAQFFHDPDWYVTYTPDSDRLQEVVEEELLDTVGEASEAEEEEATPPEERVLHRFDDGFYVLELQSSELPDEGRKMRMCVGRPEMGYIRAVRRGEVKILSLRRPSGKPLITFEVDLDDGVPVRVIQAKGKANRLPGWDLGKVGVGPVKEGEVKKAAAVVRALGLAPLDVRDLVPGLQAVDGEPPRINPAADPEQHCGFCAPQGAGGGCVPRKGRRT